MTTQVHTHEASLSCQARMMVPLSKQKVQNDNLALFLEKMLNFDFEPVNFKMPVSSQEKCRLRA